MSAETILNLMVAASAINTVASARFTVTERRLKFAEHGVKYGVTAALSALTMLGLYVWLSMETGYWQFAAIVAIPMLIAIGALASGKREVS